jgi:hypothetical protein
MTHLIGVVGDNAGRREALTAVLSVMVKQGAGGMNEDVLELVRTLTTADGGRRSLLSRYFRSNGATVFAGGGGDGGGGAGGSSPNYVFMNEHNSHSIYCAKAAVKAVAADAKIRAHADVGAAAERRVAAIDKELSGMLDADLLPPAKMLKEFANDLAGDHSISQASFGALLPWVVQGLLFARYSKDLKLAVRKVLSNSNFCTRIHHKQLVNSFKGALSVILERLGEPLLELYTRLDLGQALAKDVVTPLLHAGSHVWRGGNVENIVASGNTNSKAGLNQLTMLPASREVFDFVRLGRMDEELYLHALLMLSSAVNFGFQNTVRDVAARCKSKVTVQTVAPKSFTRAQNKSVSKVDYRDKPKPRSAYCVDTVRNMVVVPDVAALKEFVDAVCTAFGGAVRCKNIMTMSEADRAERFHLCPLMLTVPYNTGMTFAELASMDVTKGIWDQYRADSEAPHERWDRMTVDARKYLESKELSQLTAGLYGARFPTEIYTRGCHWIPRMFA